MDEIFDLIIIGSGPAGMMAGIVASGRGLKVCILEKNDRVGKKLLITGKGRCNITNFETDTRKFITNFGKNGKFLYSALDQFGVEDTVRFFEDLNLKTKIERGNRVFPESDKASDVVRVLEKELRRKNVEIRCQQIVKKVNKVGRVYKVNTGKDEFLSRNVLIATGGKSYPLTGSTGDGYVLARNFGHKIVDCRPALVPIILKEKYVRELEGLSLKNVEISIHEGEKVLISKFGEALFTSDGMSGPVILELSRELSYDLRSQPSDSLLKECEICDLRLAIDFKPALSREQLDQRILSDFAKYKNKQFKNSLDDLLPAKIRPIFIRLSEIDPEKKVNSITRDERNKLINLFKGIRLTIQDTRGFDEAIITAGGVDLKEINPKTMESKLISGLYFAGEVIDLDGPTGGYNLQMCWSSGYAVGTNIKI